MMPNFEEPRHYSGKARLRARDIRENPALRNIDPALRQTLETLAEQDGTLRLQIEGLADLVNKSIDNIMILTNVIQAATGKIDHLLPQPDAIKEVKDIALSQIKAMDPDEAGS